MVVTLYNSAELVGYVSLSFWLDLDILHGIIQGRWFIHSRHSELITGLKYQYLHIKLRKQELYDR